jgi:hypothetical protein
MGSSRMDKYNSIRKLARDFNVLRRSVTTYPSRHQVPEQALARSLATLSEITGISGSLVIGVTRNVIIADGETIELKDAVIKDFADALCSLGVVSVTFLHSCGPEELRLFNECLLTKSDSAAGQSGIQKVFDNAGFEHITVKTIDYGALSVQTVIPDDTATGHADFWEQFVQGVLAGTISAVVTRGADAKLPGAGDPEKLASLFQDHLAQDSGEALSVILKLVSNYMKQVDQDTLISDPLAVSKFIFFLQALKPETRDSFLRSALDALAIRPEVAEGLLDNFTGEMISDLLNKGTKTDAPTPPVILYILLRLARRRGIAVSAGSQDLLPDGDEAGEYLLKHKLQMAFREDKKDKFISDECHDTLQAMLAGGVVGHAEENEIEDLVKTLSDHELEVQISNIIIELLGVPAEGLTDDAELSRSLLDSCGYFLKTGDFVTLTRIYDGTKRIEQADGCCSAIQNAFTETQFVDEVLRSPAIWGKEKLGAIAGLIKRIGEPAMGPLLDRLADEQTASVRRFYMDIVTDFGIAAVDPVSQRISSHKWYFVRNLVVILRRIGRPEAVPVLKRLQKHENVKVLTEVQRTLLHMKDANGFVMLRESLDNADPFVRIDAINLAAQYNNPDIVHKLRSIVDEGRFSEDEIEIKKAAIRSLTAAGEVSCLPCFKKILKKKPFLHQAGLRPVQEEIIAALVRLPFPEARDLLGQVREFGSRYLRQRVEEVENSARERSREP